MAAAAAVALVVVLLECVAFNLPFWTTLAASTDTASRSNSLGPGLERREDGMLVVVDPTQAYLDVPADGTSPYARIDPAPPEAIERAEREAADSGGDASVLRTVLVRADGDGEAGRSTSVCVDAPRSLYLRVARGSGVRLWIEEPAGSVVPFAAVRANVRVPFRIDAARVAVMLAVVALVALWRPGSRLWRITLDTSSRRQRLAFAALLAPFAVATIAVAVWQATTAGGPLTFHKDGAYTYDFEQYGRIADALIHGRVWVDLPVDEALAQAADPYDVDVRNRLLADGVTLYWDYAYHDGHWYSYFGVLPAVVLFVPYQLLTGRMLPSAAAEYLLMFGFLVSMSLLVIRLVRRMAPRASLAATSMAVVFALLASNAPYLWFRTNFYSVPCAASLLLTSLGLWLWLGASMPRRRPAPAPAHAAPLKLGHLAGGALCIAANFGCRPAFCLVALLAVPLFRTQIAALCRGVARRSVGVREALRMPLAVILPAVAIVLPLMAYNAARFGSPFDFGNRYQFTVTDMTAFAPSWPTFLQLIGYYLFLPLRFTAEFPFLGLSPTPLHDWAYAEEMIGGFFMLCPPALAALALPFLRRRMRACGCWPTLTAGLALALALVAFDAWAGGLGWRYMIDFGWLIALAALPALLMLVGDWSRVPRTGAARAHAWAGLAAAAVARVTGLAPKRHAALIWCRRALALALLGFALAVTVLGFFVPGRDDALLSGNAALYHTVAAWFL